MYDKLTQSDIRKMEEEIEHRKLVVRPKALEDVKEARAQGEWWSRNGTKCSRSYKFSSCGRDFYGYHRLKIILEDQQNHVRREEIYKERRTL